MDLINNLLIGFEAALSLQNILYCFFGVTIGTLIGVLPGMGPVATVAMLLPATYALDPSSALIMLAGIYYGAQYGGSTTAILVNIPGEAAAVVTCIDGHKMAKTAARVRLWGLQHSDPSLPGAWQHYLLPPLRRL